LPVPAVSYCFGRSKRRLMRSLFDEQQRREAAARAEAEELHGRIAQLGERLAGAEERPTRLVIAREVVDEVLGGGASAEVPRCRGRGHGLDQVGTPCHPARRVRRDAERMTCCPAVAERADVATGVCGRRSAGRGCGCLARSARRARGAGWCCPL